MMRLHNLLFPLWALSTTGLAHDTEISHFHFDPTEIRFPYSDTTTEDKIKKWLPETFVRLDGQTGDYNCHGATFMCGEGWVDDPSSMYSDEDEVSRWEARLGDVIVWTQEGEENPVHSSVILSAYFIWGATWVSSKHGIMAYYAERLNNTRIEYGNRFKIYRPGSDTTRCVFSSNGWIEYNTDIINDDTIQLYTDWIANKYGLSF